MIPPPASVITDVIALVKPSDCVICSFAHGFGRRMKHKCSYLTVTQLEKSLLTVKCKPRRVLFYSFNHQHWWEQIAAKQFEPPALSLLAWAWGETSLFAKMPHASIRLRGKGARIKVFAGVGLALREKLR
jgi:hypothetical protein